MPFVEGDRNRVGLVAMFEQSPYKITSVNARTSKGTRLVSHALNYNMEPVALRVQIADLSFDQMILLFFSTHDIWLPEVFDLNQTDARFGRAGVDA